MVRPGSRARGADRVRAVALHRHGEGAGGEPGDARQHPAMDPGAARRQGRLRAKAAGAAHLDRGPRHVQRVHLVGVAGGRHSRPGPGDRRGEAGGDPERQQLRGGAGGERRGAGRGSPGGQAAHGAAGREAGQERTGERRHAVHRGERRRSPDESRRPRSPRWRGCATRSSAHRPRPPSGSSTRAPRAGGMVRRKARCSRFAPSWRTTGPTPAGNPAPACGCWWMARRWGNG